VLRLADAYKQLNAPFGKFGMDTLAATTEAMKTGTAGNDADYAAFEQRLTDLTAQRDALAAQIRSALNDAAFGGASLNEQQAKSWIDQANGLIAAAGSLGS
jgi:uncharacterized protein